MSRRVDTFLGIVSIVAGVVGFTLLHNLAIGLLVAGLAATFWLGYDRLPTAGQTLIDIGMLAAGVAAIAVAAVTFTPWMATATIVAMTLVGALTVRGMIHRSSLT